MLTWLKAARPLAHGNIAPPILFGAALGCSVTGTLSGWGLAIALLFGVLDHLTIVFFNDVMDEAIDRANDAPTLVSGGSRVLVEGKLRPASLLRAARIAAVALVVLSLAGTVLAPARPLALPLLALAALALLWLYSGAPVRLSYRGGGAWLQGLGTGVVLPLVGFVLQSPTAIDPMQLAPSFVLAVAGNVLTALPDAEPDARGGKRTLASQRGVRVAAWVAILLSTIGLVLGASTFASSPLEAQLLTAIPLAFLVPSLVLLRSVEADRGRRLRFVLLGLGAGTSALLAWSVAVLTP